MSKEAESKQQIIKSSSIIGGASVINILISLIKVKALAMLLGPAGVGLMSLLTSIMTTASTVAGMGLPTSGVRQLAQSNNDAEVLAKVRKSLWTANVALGLLGGALVWLLRKQIAVVVFDDINRVNDVGLLGIGVFLTLLASSQTALLQGLRKIAELAKVNIISAFLATAIGLLSVYLLGEKGLIVFVLAVPFSGVIAAWFYCSRLPRPSKERISLSQLVPQWQSMMKLGFTFMLAGLMTQLTQLIVRYIITDEIGLQATGHFQAAWAISMTYIGFVLAAMGADYYPRLTAIIHDKQAANSLVNQQTEIALLLSAPVLIAMLAFAPLVINVLYSSEFSNSVEILRWQVLGDVFKIISWPMGFILLAQGRAKFFFCTELTWNVLYSSLVYFGIENNYGLISAGIAFLISYIVCFIVVFILARKLIDFRMSKEVLKVSLLLVMCALLVCYLAYISKLISGAVGTVLAVLFALHTVKSLASLGYSSAKLNNIVGKVRRLF